MLWLEGMFEGPRFEGAPFEGALDSLRDGGVKGRYPPPLTLSPDRFAFDAFEPVAFDPGQLEPEDLLLLAGRSERALPVPLLLFGGVKGRKPPRFPFSADGLAPRWVCTLPGADERGLLLFCGGFGRAFDGVGGRYPPRFPFTADGLLAPRVAGLLIG